MKAEHVFRTLDVARGGPVDEGSVGGGTGMVAYGFKAGIGTASRHVALGGHTYTVGVLVQANFGARDQLLIAGVPIGRELTVDAATSTPAKEGSIIVVIATDAPLLPNQLRRLALRATHGVARVGGMSGTRIVATLINELRRRGGGTGAAALCGGGGQGDAAIVRTL